MNALALLWIILCACAALPCVIALINNLTVISLKTSSAQCDSDSVSVLIPARNEEKNLAHCLESVLSQQGNCVTEVIVYDDCSVDGTAEIVHRFSAADARVRCIAGSALPKGWLGKNYACSHLAEAASGNLLLFIDADVTLSKSAVRAAAEQMHKYNAGLVSAFPAQIIPHGSAWAVTPIMNRILLSWLMLALVPRTRTPSIAAANGQFMLFTRNCYYAVGGHTSVRLDPVEDIALARRVKKTGGRVLTVLGGECIQCAMYPNAKTARNGFTKKLYPGTGLPVPVFLSIVLYSETVFCRPLLHLPL